MQIDLGGDTAVVTGAAQGNGLAIARGLASAGAAVALLDLDGDRAEAAARAIEAEGGRAFAHTLNVADMAACREAAAMVERELGPTSILVNNAGVLFREALDSERFEETWRTTLGVNVDGCMNMVRAFLPQLRSNHGSRIVNVGSIASFIAAGTATAYVTSKGAVLQMTKALSIDLAADGIRVNGIAPGRIITRMTEAHRDDPEVKAAYFSRAPLGRYGETEDLVGPVLFLVSSLSQYVTGAMLPVDGGFLAA